MGSIKLRRGMSAESPGKVGEEKIGNDTVQETRPDPFPFLGGQDKKAGIHASEIEWRLFTNDKDLAIRRAKLHIE
jgi:hypothetical protein